MQSFNDSSDLFTLDGLDSMPGSLNGLDLQQGFQDITQWHMPSSMAPSTLTTLYESDRMATHTQAISQSQPVTQAPYAYPTAAFLARQKGGIAEQLATHVAHPKIQVQGFDLHELTVDPTALTSSAASPMHMSLLSPRLEQLSMDFNFTNLSPVTPSDASWPTSATTQPMAIPSGRHGRAGSVSSLHRQIHSPYHRHSPYVPNADMLVATMSPSSDTSFLDGPSSYQASSDMTVFTDSQIPAAQNIRQYQAMHPGMAIPAALITSELAEIADGKGWCLIGKCGIERASNKMTSGYDLATDKKRKRLDHLYDHIRDKHFNCRPHQCFVCFNSFAREHDLKRHEKIHQAVSLPCDFCDKVYTRKDNLQRHMENKHTNSLPAKPCGPH